MILRPRLQMRQELSQKTIKSITALKDSQIEIQTQRQQVTGKPTPRTSEIRDRCNHKRHGRSQKGPVDRIVPVKLLQFYG